MRKKITTSLLITCMILLSCKAQNHSVTEKNSSVVDSTLVYENNKAIGKISQPTTYNCKACYTINKIEDIKIKVPVSNKVVNNQSVLEQDFAIDKVIKNGNNTVIKYSSTSSSKAYELEVNKDYIFRMLTYSYGSKDMKIGENDYASFQTNSICQSEKKIKIKDTITLNDSYVFATKDCFDCPVKYTIEECIANRKKGVKMNWE
ncbi:hypothetical protein [Flavobacterium lindanitolerans]|jgi:hypothetical protein|uniref:hypothetical protein n=1 Tax=Flavobacterium lindanitolerans TaxID=428988 RepID=UPI0023F0FD8F|nr:hypothetical protein [Flavobacterium lindanitolerans]